MGNLRATLLVRPLELRAKLLVLGLDAGLVNDHIESCFRFAELEG